MSWFVGVLVAVSVLSVGVIGYALYKLVCRPIDPSGT